MVFLDTCIGTTSGTDQEETAPKSRRTIVVVPPQIADLVPAVVP